ncbi:ComEC/Rec2 family competence protein [Mycolicibacterium thermoresistibile]
MTDPGGTGAEHYDLRLVPAAGTAWAVTAAGIAWPVGGAVSTALIAVALTAAGGWWGSGRPGADAALRTLTAGVVAVAAVAAAMAVAIILRTDQVARHPMTDRYGTVATVVVTPTESPRPVGGGRLMFRGALRSANGQDMSGRVLVFASAARYGELIAGQPAGFTARIGRPSRRDLTVATLSASGTPVPGEAAALLRAGHHIRAAFADSARAVLPAEQAAILPGLVLGDTSAVSGRVTAEFRASGLTHLTAVSGANVTIVCGAVLLSAALVGPRCAVVAAALTLAAFVIVVLPSASVLRAAVMAAITLLAMVSHRRRQAIPALAASVIMLIVTAPELAVDVGFALSVAATGALIVIAPVWSRRLTGRGWPKPLADAVSIAAAAQLVTAPLIAGISGRLSLVSVAANLAVAVVIPPITVLGTAAAAVSACWPDGAQLLIRFVGPEVWWLLSVARWAAAVPGSAVPVPAGLGGVVTVAAGGVAVVAAWRWRWVRWSIAGLSLGLVAWTVAGPGPSG